MVFGGLLIMRIVLPEHGQPRAERTHIRRDIAEGWRWLWHNPAGPARWR
ncbi:MAG: hypothetical protein U0R78_09805 [Nocardioidaceae bacterium]